MANFTINIRALKAVAIAASTDETRYYLNGVCLTHSDSGLIMVATNGHRLLAVKQEWTETVPDAPFANVIVPLSFIKKIKLARKIDHGEITLGEDHSISIQYAGETMGINAVAGSFPDWRRVMPNKPHSNVPAQFNADYVADFVAAGRMLSNDKDAKQPVISHDGGNPAIVNWYFGEGEGLEAIGVLMPIRVSDECHKPAPAWAIISTVEQ